MEIKAEVAEIKKMVNELYGRLFILAYIITEVEPKIQVKSMENSRTKGGRKKRKKEKKSTIV